MMKGRSFNMKNDSNAIFTTPEAARAEIEFLLGKGRELQEQIDHLKRPEVFRVGEDTYISAGGRYERVKPSLPEKLVKPEPFYAYSLDGLIEYIREDVDGCFHDKEVRHIVRVVDPGEVEVVSPVAGYWRERIVVARCMALTPEIKFGTYMDQENFQVMVQTCFEESENRAKVLQLVGNLRKEQSMQTADDGVSQKVTVNAGVVKAADVIVRNPVPLTPFRTFREVEQPESPFVLRVNEEARAALFTGDGSAWMLQAVARIGEYLRHNLQGYNVVVIA